ncbi:MAG: hypothetical protein Kow0068_13280 [Marinilabiliales bacterium]
MNKIKILLLFVIVILMNSCKIECPSFDKSLLTWFPYEVGDQLMYTNQHNDTLIFSVKSKNLSESYKEKKRFEDECISDAVFYLSDDFSTIAYSQYYFTIDYDESGITIKYNIELLISDNVYCSGSGSSDIECCLDTITINNRLYQEAVIIERDTINFSDEIWKVIVANNYGIIKFHDRETGYEWTLVNK